jgi:NAD-dependent deacetylase
MRPDIVWFGESLDPGIIGRAFAAAEDADVCIVIGTSALVHPAASIPLATRDAGGAIIEINPDVTPLSSEAALTLRGSAATVVSTLFP